MPRGIDRRNYPDNDLTRMGVAKRRSIGGKTIHTFGSTGEAYNETQTSDKIKFGDVLHVPDERVAGFLYSAWPVSVSKEHGHLDYLTDPTKPPDTSDYPGEDYTESHRAARALSKKKGYH